MTAPMDDLLAGLTRLRGVHGVMIVSAQDGLMVSAALMDDVKGPAVAALTATVLGRANSLAARSGRRAPRFLHLQAAEGVLLFAPAAGDLLLVVVAGRDVMLGPVRLEMLRVVERLA